MGNTHENILKAAKLLFSTKGYAATTTKDIANLAEISEVTLFRHFESKRKLFHCAIHSTFEGQLLVNFFENELKYDLDKDLIKLAHYLYILYEENADLIKMHIKDKENFEISEISKPKVEMKVKTLSCEYFEKMHKMGIIPDEPKMCREFFFSNAIGFLMRKFVFSKYKDGSEYYNWMIAKTISAIKIDSNKKIERNK